MNALLVLSALVACERDNKEDDTGKVIINDSGTTKTDDSGTTDDTGTKVNCTLEVDNIEPSDGTTGWFYRDPLVVDFSEDGAAATVEVFETDTKTPATTTATWADGNLQAAIQADLLGDTEYTLSVTTCGDVTETTFTTDEYGSPLTKDVKDLDGRVYLLDLGAASFPKPSGVGGILALYIEQPLLLGVESVTDLEIDLIGAQGEPDDSGFFSQVSGLQTFDFPAASFTDAPYFQGSSDLVKVDYGSFTFDFWDFDLEGTFSPDGSSIGGGVARALADVSTLGPAMELGDDPYAVCDLLTKLIGEGCVACPGGEKKDTCVYLRADLAEAPHLTYADPIIPKK